LEHGRIATKLSAARNEAGENVTLAIYGKKDFAEALGICCRRVRRSKGII
jgi:hypothetical protein